MDKQLAKLWIHTLDFALLILGIMVALSLLFPEIRRLAEEMWAIGALGIP
jgi:hypothetical protein